MRDVDNNIGYLFRIKNQYGLIKINKLMIYLI